MPAARSRAQATPQPEKPRTSAARTTNQATPRRQPRTAQAIRSARPPRPPAVKANEPGHGGRRAAGRPVAGWDPEAGTPLWTCQFAAMRAAIRPPRRYPTLVCGRSGPAAEARRRSLRPGVSPGFGRPHAEAWRDKRVAASVATSRENCPVEKGATPAGGESGGRPRSRSGCGRQNRLPEKHRCM
jgi:hypothetical protein